MSYLQKRRAFTLIELLTVIAIIGILAAILIPVVGKVRDSAKASVCASNIRQIGLAMIMYGSETGTFPALASNGNPNLERDWIRWRRGDHPRDSAIAPYLGGEVDENLFRCPADMDYLERTYRYSYAMNSFVGLNSQIEGGGGIHGKFEMIRDPSRIVLLVEEDGGDDGHFSFSSNDVALRHSGKGNVVFCDGSAQAVTRADLQNVRNQPDRSRFDPLYRGR